MKHIMRSVWKFSENCEMKVKMKLHFLSHSAAREVLLSVFLARFTARPLAAARQAARSAAGGREARALDGKTGLARGPRVRGSSVRRARARAVRQARQARVRRRGGLPRGVRRAPQGPRVRACGRVPNGSGEGAASEAGERGGTSPAFPSLPLQPPW